MGDDPFSYSAKLGFLRRVCVDPRLQRTSVAVAAVLIDHANKGTGKCYPSVSTIVAESRVPKTTTLRALRRLEEAGWIESEKRFGAVTHYTLTGAAIGTGSDAGTGANWNTTGAIQNLRVGQTGSGHGTEAVPTPEHKQRDLKATGRTEVANAVAPQPVDRIWGAGLELLISKGVPEAKARPALGKCINAHGLTGTLTLLAQIEHQDIVDPVSWLMATTKGKGKANGGGRLARDTRTEDEQIEALEREMRRREELRGATA